MKNLLFALFLVRAFAGPVYVNSNGTLFNFNDGSGQSTNFFQANYQPNFLSLSNKLTDNEQGWYVISTGAPIITTKNYTNYAAVTSERFMTATPAIDAMMLVFVNAGIGAGVSDFASAITTNAVEIGASIYVTNYNAGSANTNWLQFTFNGKQIAPLYNNAQLLFSDPLGVTLPYGALYQIRTWENASGSVTNYQNGQTPLFSSQTYQSLIVNWDTRGTAGSAGTVYGTSDNSGVEYAASNTTNYAPDLIARSNGAGTTYAYALNTYQAISASANSGFFPQAILGHCSYSQARALAIIGDSIFAGTGCVLDADPTYGLGWPRMAYGLATGNYVMPIVQLAVGGEKLSDWVYNNNAALRSTLLPYCKYAITDLGINDLKVNTNAIQCETEMLALWNRLQALGVRVVQTTITPETSSTDFWLTKANQTAVTTYNFATNRATVNIWLRAGAPILNGAPVAVGTSGALTMGQFGHPLINIIDIGAYVESQSGTNSCIWNAPETAAYSGTSTAGTTTVLTDSGASWPTTGNNNGGGLVGYQLIDVTQNKASQIVFNTATTVTVNPAISGMTTGDTYKIIQGWVYEDGNGIHPSHWGALQMAAWTQTNYGTNVFN